MPPLCAVVNTDDERLDSLTYMHESILFEQYTLTGGPAIWSVDS